MVANEKVNEKSALTEQKFSLIQLTDAYINEMMEIEHLSFTAPWSKASYLHDLNENPLAYYSGCLYNGHLIGYAGVWQIMDEGHISNVAVHPDFRGRRVGELLLRHIFCFCLQHEINRVTLEVRKSNLSAQKLYERLGFRCVGARPKYYADNQEDAYIYWCELKKAGEINHGENLGHRE
jgi:ribosomal-protein-alanine N-acetyltransferase